ncbi:transposable element Tc3 transposase [Trichonephila clavipes]|nr:transposable element Tc3 transposase [Trichonephila clavipes]
MLVGLSDVFHLLQLTLACDELGVESMHCGHRVLCDVFRRVQSVTMTGHIYRDVILEQHVRLFRGPMGAGFLFMDDKARPHRANIVDECLQSADITRMD